MQSSDLDIFYVLADILESGAITTLFSGIPSTLINIAVYVLTAFGLYTIANRRGISKPWLAWIPVVDVWILGSISDQYRYVVKGQNKSKRKALVTLSIISCILSVIAVILIVALVLGAVGAAMSGISEAEALEQVMGAVVCVLVFCLPLMGVAIAHAIVYFMALYDVYHSCDPSNSVLFLVLSILFGITTPFFLFFSRNKDGGMPPRRQNDTYQEPVSYIPQEPVWQPNEPVREPWEQDNKDYL